MWKIYTQTSHLLYMNCMIQVQWFISTGVFISIISRGSPKEKAITCIQLYLSPRRKLSHVFNYIFLFSFLWYQTPVSYLQCSTNWIHGRNVCGLRHTHFLHHALYCQNKTKTSEVMCVQLNYTNLLLWWWTYFFCVLLHLQYSCM